MVYSYFMDYEDGEILWISEEEKNDPELYKKLMVVNLCVRICDSSNTFDVIKNRWGNDFENASLNYLDMFFDSPEANWSRILNESKMA